MITTYKAAPDVDVLASAFTMPGFGCVAINAFVLHGPEPLLVDTGTVIEREEFMTALRTVIDPADLRWIWLSHPDPDHVGSLRTLLAENPRIRLITTFLGTGILGLTEPPPMDRINLVNPGERIVVGNRTLRGVRPPAFDNPITMGFFDETSRTLFSADCFGALVDEVPQNAAELSEEALRKGQIFWTSVDSSWIHKVDQNAYSAELRRYGALEPKLVLSGHLPAAPGSLMPRLLENLGAVPDAPEFVGPNQAALETMLAQMGQAPA